MYSRMNQTVSRAAFTIPAHAAPGAAGQRRFFRGPASFSSFVRKAGRTDTLRRDFLGFLFLLGIRLPGLLFPLGHNSLLRVTSATNVPRRALSHSPRHHSYCRHSLSAYHRSPSAYAQFASSSSDATSISYGTSFLAPL